MIESDKLHKLLKRQLKKHFKNVTELSPETEKLLYAVNQAYFEFDDDIKRSELILDQSMKELFTANVELKKIAEKKTAEANTADQRLQFIVDSVSEIIFQSDTNGKLSYLNSAWERITGYTVEETIGTDLLDYIHPEEVLAINQLRKKVKSSSERCQVTLRLKTKSGELIWVQISAKQASVGNHNSLGVSGTIADVTQTFLTQHENNRLALFAQKSQNIVITTNTKGEVDWVNRAFTNVTGYTLNEVLGKKPGRILQGPKTDQKTIESIRNHVIQKKPFTGEIYNYDKQGNGYWLEISIDPIFEEGKHLGYIAVETVISERKQQQENLEYKKLLLKEAQSLSKIGSWEFIIKTEEFNWSEEMYNIMGIDPDSPISRSSYISKIHPEDVDKFKMAIIDAFNNNRDNFVEHRIIDKKGNIRFLRGIGKPIFDSKGIPIAMRGSVQDITKEKKIEARLIKYQNDLDEAQLLSKVGSFEYNAKNKEIEWSKNAYAVFELSSFTKLNELDFDQYLHPEDLENFKNSWKDSILTQKPFNIVYRFSPRKETMLYIEGSGQPIFDTNNKLIKIVGTVQNITERKQVELLIKRNEEKYKNLLETMDLGILEVNNAGIITNAFDKFCEMVGYTKEELIGRDPNHFLIDPDQIPIIDHETKNRTKGKTGLYELLLKKKDQTYFWALISGAPVYNDQHQLIGSLGIHMDITERKKSEESLKKHSRDLEKINSELDQFAYIVSHDLKAPLRAINNLSLWIEEDINELIEGETKDYFQLLRGRVNRMENLINGILEYSRAGRLKTKEEEIELSELFTSLSDSLKMKDNVKFIYNNELTSIKTERVALEQVFSNFISNGIKHNDKKDIIIELGAKECGNQYQFYVKDNGPGIEEAFHKKIFQIFQTLNARDKVESTGVGLAIVKKIIEEKEGTIKIDSILGKGTTIFFTWNK